MIRTLLTLVLLLASGAPSAQESVHIRLDHREMEEGAISLAGLVRGLHIITSWDDMAPQEIVLFSAVVAEGEVVARGQSPFIAMAIDDELPEGITLRDSRIEMDQEYAERRAEMAIRADVFIPGGDQFFPKASIPGGDQFFPGENYERGAEQPLAFPGQSFIGGRASVDARRGASDRDIVRAAQRAHPRAFESGESFLIFFASGPEGDAMSEIAVLRKKPAR